MPDETLPSDFHPLVARWFRSRFGDPTEIQTQAWELISRDRHCLISAATGSGKTLAAFLWGINQLASGRWELGQTRMLYISPLKALNNDIRRNLLTPLEELKAVFEEDGLDWPEIRVKTRSGDTEPSERRKMLRKPPEILITTPESLNLLLTTKDGQRALLGVESVILDEIHSVVDSKRGVYLMTAVERLARLNGEFQRIALSATVKPLELVGAFVGGFLKGKARELALAQSSARKRYQIEIRFSDDGIDDDSEDAWTPVVHDLKVLIDENQSTLVFVNSRMLSEKIAHRINLGEETPIAYSHHGSLSKEIRFAVEQRLKNGELKAIVATNSLEMGIDVGAIDCVVMVQSPNAISSAIQKVGRAGHQVGVVSRAVVYPSHSRDFLEAAVLADSIRERDIEELSPVLAPLDVLAQVIVSTLGPGSMDVDELFDLIRCSYSYKDLRRDLFDLVLNMLAGRYASSRLRELKPRVAIDRPNNVVALRKGALMAFYFSGGVIPDRGYFHLRVSGSGARIGELDEEFVWEASEGDVFTLGVQSWKIESITHNDVFVQPAEKGEMAPPFWKAERYDRDFHFSERIGEFLEWANGELSKKDFLSQLVHRYSLSQESGGVLEKYLRRQREFTGRDLPHRHHILAELVEAAPGGSPGHQLVLHTHWGGRVNRPYALALDAAWFEAFGHRTEVYVNNDCVVVTLTDEVGAEEALALVNAGNVGEFLRKRLEGSGFFGARFREAAGTSLLIVKNKMGQRLPLWLSRLKAKKLFESVRRYDDFPLLLEAWRVCLKDSFDMEALQLVLEELESGQIDVSHARTRVASPFAAEVAWRQINDDYMYATDDPSGPGESGLRGDLVQAVAFDKSNRPTVSNELVRAFEVKRKRIGAGYEPEDETDLKEWLRDRIAVPEAEWNALAARLGGVAIEIEAFHLAEDEWVCLSEEVERVETLFKSAQPDEDLLVEWLSYYGPVSKNWLRRFLPLLSDNDYLSLVDSLEEDRKIVCGNLLDGSSEDMLCEAENFEILLRQKRARNRPALDALPAKCLSLFQAVWQGLVQRETGLEGLERSLDQLLGWTAEVEEWERALFAARIESYQAAWLDSLMVETGLSWYGRGRSRVGFCWDEDRLLATGKGSAPEGDVETRIVERLSGGQRVSFVAMQQSLDCGREDLEAALWCLVWKTRLSNDAFAAARKGHLGKYALFANSARDAAPPVRSHRRGSRARKERAFTYPGNWYAFDERTEEEDSLALLELARERARILLDRYGVVFKELLDRENTGFRWRDVYKALRLLELSGEAVGGRFFEGILGLQFASNQALRALRKELPENAIYWVSAKDPASVCGLSIEGLTEGHPSRLSGNRLVYRGSELVALAKRGGKDLEFCVDVSDQDLLQIIACLGESLGLEAGTLGGFRIENINGKDARGSLYLESLDAVWRLHTNHKLVTVEGVRS